METKSRRKGRIIKKKKKTKTRIPLIRTMDLSEAKSRVFSAARPAIHHKLNTYAKYI